MSTPESGNDPKDIDHPRDFLAEYMSPAGRKMFSDLQDLLRADEVVAFNAETQLLQVHPELFEGKLPLELENKLEGKPYILGLQATSLHTAEDAKEELAEKGGILVANYLFTKRFALSRPVNGAASTVSETISGRYLEALTDTYPVGLFLVAFPAEFDPPVGLTKDEAIANSVPNDFFEHSTSSIGQVKFPMAIVSPKYIAGFIDINKQFIQNSSFAEAHSFTTND